MWLRRYPLVYFEMLLVGFLIIASVGLSQAFLPIMAQKLDPTGALVGLVISSWFIARTFIELPSGVISVKVGRRNLIVSGLLLCLFGSLLCAFSTSIHILILGMTVWGLGAAMFFTSNTALLLHLFEPNVRGRAVGTFQGVEFLGRFAGAPLGAILASLVGFNNVFIAAAFFLISASFVAFFSRGLKKADKKFQTKHIKVRVKEILHGLNDWSLLGVCCMNFVRTLVHNGVMSTVFQIYLNKKLGISVEMIGLLLGVRTASMICAFVTSGFLSDKLGRKTAVMLGLIISAIGQYSYTLVSSFEQFLPLVILEGAGLGFIFISLTVYMSDLVPPSMHGGAVGLFRTFMDLGGILGPVIFILIYDNVGALAPFWLASVILFSNIAMLALIRRKENMPRVIPD